MQSFTRGAPTGLAMAAIVLPGAAYAADAKNQGYLVDAITSNVVTSSTTGLCVRTSDWTPARAVARLPAASLTSATARVRRSPSRLTSARPGPEFAKLA